MSATEYVVLVDKQNRPTGIAEKQIAHQKNLLHRAFSVFLFRENEQGLELLLQQRASDKYHCGNLWTNTCCSHPRNLETVIEAGERRLKEELGITATLTDIGWFHYNAHFDNGLSENEIDHVLIGKVANDVNIQLNPHEVQAIRWLSIETLRAEIIRNPKTFTPWLHLALDIVENYFI